VRFFAVRQSFAVRPHLCRAICLAARQRVRHGNVQTLLPCIFTLPCGVQDLCRDAFLCRACFLGFAVQSFFAVRH
jgi:hypothetical protein